MKEVTTIKALCRVILSGVLICASVSIASAGALAPGGESATYKTQRKGYTEIRIRNMGPAAPADVTLSWSDLTGAIQQRRIVLVKVGTTEYYENAFGGVSVRVTNQSQNARVDVTVSKSK